MAMERKRWIDWVVLTAAFLLTSGSIWSCWVSEDPVEIPPAPPRAIQVIVTPSSASIPAGGRQVFVAQVTGGDSSTVRTVTWSVTPQGIVTIAPNGNTVIATGMVRGFATLIATHSPSQDTPPATAAAAIVVNNPPAARVELEPPGAQIEVGDTLRLQAMAYDAAGSVMQTSFTWASRNPVVASVNGGLVTGLAPGTAVILATSGATTDSSTIVVTPAAPPATGRYAFAVVDDATQSSWTVPADRSFNPAGMPVTVSHPATGEYAITFAGMEPPANAAQSVQLSGYGPAATWCATRTLLAAADDAAVSVLCFDEDHAPADAQFTVLLLESRALPGRMAFGWADQPTAASYSPSSSFSSAQPVTIERRSSGEYRVVLAGNARTTSSAREIVLVTATGIGGRCALDGDLIGEFQHVHCVRPYPSYDDDTPFMFALLEKGIAARRFAFAAVHQNGSVNLDYSYGVGGITATSSAIGRTTVTFGGLARTGSSPEAVLAVANTVLGDFCSVESWQNQASDLVANVLCFDPDGRPVNRPFRVLVIE